MQTRLVLVSMLAVGFGGVYGCSAETPTGPAPLNFTSGGAGSGAGGASVGAGGMSTGAGGGSTGASGTVVTGGSGTGGSGGAGVGGAGGSADNNTGGTAGSASGAAGSASGAAGSNDADASGGAAGSPTDDSGAAAPMVCMNAAVVTPGGTAANCPAVSKWVATADPTPAKGLLGIADNQLLPQYAIDGVMTTRYTTGKAAEAGNYFQVDLGATASISGITIYTADAPDVAGAYKVELSSDGSAWMEVASCMYPPATNETVNFAAKSARYVRLTNTAASPNGKWWSIHEFGVVCQMP